MSFVCLSVFCVVVLFLVFLLPLFLVCVHFWYSLRQFTCYPFLFTMHLQAKIVAMTCTHAALNRSNLVKLKFKYDNIVMEECGQILEVETFIPMLLQDHDGKSRNSICISFFPYEENNNNNNRSSRYFRAVSPNFQHGITHTHCPSISFHFDF